MPEVIQAKTHTITKKDDTKIVFECNTEKIRDELFDGFVKVQRMMRYLPKKLR